MSNGEIANEYAGLAWMGAGIGLALWSGVRSRRASRLLRGEAKGWPPDQRDWLRTRLIIEAFAAGGIWMACFLLFDWIW